MRNAKPLVVGAGVALWVHLCGVSAAKAQADGPQAQGDPVASFIQRFQSARDPEEKVQCLLRVEACGKGEFAEPLSEILLDETQPWLVRFFAASNLARTGSPKAVAPLAKIVLDYALSFYPNDNSEGWEGRMQVAGWAITCLGECGEAAAPVLLEFLEDDVMPGSHSSFITALGQTGSVEALETVLGYVDDERGGIRAQAAGALGGIVPNVKEEGARTRIKDAVVRLAADEDSDVRENAVRSLSAFPDDAEVIALLERIAREDPYVGMVSEGDSEYERHTVRDDATYALNKIKMHFEQEAIYEEWRQRQLAYAAEAHDLIRQFEHPTFDGQRESALWNMGWYARTICGKDTLTTDDMAALDHLQQVFETIKGSGNEEERTTAQQGLATIEQRLEEPAKRPSRTEDVK